jgi:hypothetical protein
LRIFPPEKKRPIKRQNNNLKLPFSVSQYLFARAEEFVDSLEYSEQALERKRERERERRCVFIDILEMRLWEFERGFGAKYFAQRQQFGRALRRL